MKKIVSMKMDIPNDYPLLKQRNAIYDWAVKAADLYIKEKHGE